MPPNPTTRRTPTPDWQFRPAQVYGTAAWKFTQMAANPEDGRSDTEDLISAVVAVAFSLQSIAASLDSIDRRFAGLPRHR